jgi:hypothetical protein
MGSRVCRAQRCNQIVSIGNGSVDKRRHMRRGMAQRPKRARRPHREERPHRRGETVHVDQHVRIAGRHCLCHRHVGPDRQLRNLHRSIGQRGHDIGRLRTDGREQQIECFLW